MSDPNSMTDLLAGLHESMVNAALSRHSGSILAREVDRLRAELAETRAAGDALAAAALVVDEHWQDDCVTREQVECLLRTAQAWRSVRGDAPAGSSEATEDQS